MRALIITLAAAAIAVPAIAQEKPVELKKAPDLAAGPRRTAHRKRADPRRNQNRGAQLAAFNEVGETGRREIAKTHHALLRARRERPSCCAAEHCDELASLHSITSSASASSRSGT